MPRDIPFDGQVCRQGMKGLSVGPLQIVGGAAAIARRDDFEADALAFDQFAQIGAFNGADVNEHILAALIRLNEAVTFGSIEPFDRSDSHRIFLFVLTAFDAAAQPRRRTFRPTGTVPTVRIGDGDAIPEQ